ncbi:MULTISPECIES: ester cyclase [unclassified Halomonas]|uniref:ester cyclase n=1 Tax=unclassified Halomonas TaxID=2609666 RepID=UPI000C98D553|nr:MULTISPECIES: ester cyclase [unclassified Halomonas]MAR71989.1 polyketide cyclase [Halomonas sp.]
MMCCREVIDRWRALWYDKVHGFDDGELECALAELMHDECHCHLAYPLGECVGPEELLESIYRPLLAAVPDLERRDYIVVSGAAYEGIGGPPSTAHWVGCAGFYTGVFETPWLDIPATGHIMTLRYAEFFRIESGRIVEMRALWDIPEVMLGADAWPMVPSLGCEMLVPGPATQDGIHPGLGIEPEGRARRAAASLDLVNRMLEGLGRYAEGGVAAMELERYWHPRLMWYGPAGIGSGRRVSGFRQWHQRPFLAGMPDRRNDGHHVVFSEGDYVALCGWPALEATISGDGWLGIAPGGQQVRLRSLDFWRCEDALIRENWVLVDLLDVYRQLGVDVLARMRQMTGGLRSERSSL